MIAFLLRLQCLNLPQHYMFPVGSHKEEAVAESDGSGCYKVSIRDLPTLTAGEKIVE